jgi:hypothetical protein
MDITLIHFQPYHLSIFSLSAPQSECKGLNSMYTSHASLTRTTTKKGQRERTTNINNINNNGKE